MCYCPWDVNYKPIALYENTNIADLLSCGKYRVEGRLGCGPGAGARLGLSFFVIARKVRQYGETEPEGSTMGIRRLLTRVFSSGLKVVVTDAGAKAITGPVKDISGTAKDVTGIRRDLVETKLTEKKLEES
jgi:hypothetical protein